MHGTGPELDRTVPALLVKVGRYPEHHGGVGVIRTLGRRGVPVHAMVEDRFTPAAQ
jgi:D-aspartate ligase